MYVFLQDIHPSFNSTHMSVISGYLEEFFVVRQQNTILTYPHMVKKRLRHVVPSEKNTYIHVVPSPYIACPSNDWYWYWYCITLTLSHKLPVSSSQEDRKAGDIIGCGIRMCIE